MRKKCLWWRKSLITGLILLLALIPDLYINANAPILADSHPLRFLEADFYNGHNVILNARRTDCCSFFKLERLYFPHVPFRLFKHYQFNTLRLSGFIQRSIGIALGIILLFAIFYFLARTDDEKNPNLAFKLIRKTALT